MNFKRCFKCKRNLPLFMYHTDHSKYQRESAKGKVIECRLCGLKRMRTDKGIMQRLDGKFVFVQMDRVEIIKYLVKR